MNLRFAYFCIEDDIVFRINGTTLPQEDAEITDERAMHMPRVPAYHRGEIYAPPGMSVHWFKWRLDPALITQGENVVEIECREFEKRGGIHAQPEWGRNVGAVQGIRAAAGPSSPRHRAEELVDRYGL